MIVFFLPVLFVVILGPAALQLSDTFSKNGGAQNQKHATK
jgi:hypothetical protein